ncbi:hypothetical protein [Streptomyces sp. CC219B]|uniref:hypothetical protein n=1 Tax=Streptomyces sp. CC219B TaxID=3044574 RepID=UPI0024A8CB99|nr:hypothetical protein [Streptomyces sp. CC219B]
MPAVNRGGVTARTVDTILAGFAAARAPGGPLSAPGLTDGRPAADVAVAITTAALATRPTARRTLLSTARDGEPPFTSRPARPRSSHRRARRPAAAPPPLDFASAEALTLAVGPVPRAFGSRTAFRGPRRQARGRPTRPYP